MRAGAHVVCDEFLDGRKPADAFLSDRLGGATVDDRLIQRSALGGTIGPEMFCSYLRRS